MQITDIAVHLADLHESADFRATRFDAGEPFRGRVGVLPSAYNPPTRAHLGLLQLAMETDGITSSAALLTTRNVDKSIFGAPLSHRIGMLLAARAADGEFAVLGCNAARISDQGFALRETFPEAQFDFVAGFDVLIRLFDPKYYDDMRGSLDVFFAHHRLIVTNRGQNTVDTVVDYLDEPVVRDYRAGIVVRELDAFAASLSSSAVRHAHATGKADELTALVPEVQAYIDSHGLYAER